MGTALARCSPLNWTARRAEHLSVMIALSIHVALPSIHTNTCRFIITAFTPGTPTEPFRLVVDPELSPLDLAIAPNGNIVVSSERPFDAVDAVTSVREYDPTDGHLVRVFSPNGKADFRRPRGLRFAANGLLYCVARDEVVGFDFASGECLGAIARLPRLNGQALVFFP